LPHPLLTKSCQNRYATPLQQGEQDVRLEHPAIRTWRTTRQRASDGDVKAGEFSQWASAGLDTPFTIRCQAHR
jgi:hypothetical protein